LFNQTQFVQALRELGFKFDRSTYQFDAMFLFKRCAKGVIVVSVYPRCFNASFCRSKREGTGVADTLQATEMEALEAKMKIWEES